MDQGNPEVETDFLLYTREQFLTLRRATIATSIIALVASLIVLCSFLYLWLMDRKRANRISLRCVVIACAANGVDSIMNLSMSFVEGPQSFCRAGGIISNISRLTSASFLAIVGINLVLIFVINVKRRDLLEYFYYPSVILYVLVCTVVSVYKAVTAENVPQPHDTCWYLTYIIQRSYAIFSWMWYYGFLFFINILAGISSAIALYKLIHEQRALRKNIDNTTYMGEASTNQIGSRIQRRHSAILSKVVTRCIIYPLIPLLVNIWGFGIQMMMTVSNSPPPFILAMFDTVFACLEGFFVLIVFFTDPALTAFLDDRLQYWRKIYVEEYHLVEIRNDSSTEAEKKEEKTHTLYIMPPVDALRGENAAKWDSAVIHANATSRYSGTTHSSVPMRRIGIPPSSLAQLSSHYNVRQLSFCTLPTTTTSSSDAGKTTANDDQPSPTIQQLPTVNFDTGIRSLSAHSQENVIHVVFIPYKSALWARVCHHILSRLASGLFSPSSSRSAPRSSSTIELRSYANPPPLEPPLDSTSDNGNIDDNAPEGLQGESKERYRISVSDQTCHL
ncbi:hypothetical protein BCR42DRAFT_400244 [Absidia repens]|uniref:Uncharacterized protein n=1 Tax=Absidia repens TaxID=90262 RepID=A0A1X2J132_9FUNG|nr:hypothetical protein BCR42DRAFT_400244 [Absidia repens]